MIEKIQQVEDNWQKPWITIAANTRNFFPQNLTGRRYAGGNAFLLLFLCEKFQYQTPVFMTFNQANEAGISVLKGSKSFPVYYFWKSHSTLPLLATQNYPFWLKYD